MKYLTLLMLVCLISCNDDKPKPINNDEKELILETPTEIVETYDLVKLSAYQQFLQKMDKTILRSNLDAMMEFKKLTATSNPMTVDSAYLHYRTFYQAFQIKQHADLEKDTSDFCYLIYGSDEEIDAQYLLRLKTKIKKFQNNGINVECSEGAPFVTEYRPLSSNIFYLN